MLRALGEFFHAPREISGEPDVVIVPVDAA
jgi:hypothetical protein